MVYTTFHHPMTRANVVTTDFSDWATNCPEYKVTAVQVTPSNGPTDEQEDYRAFSERSRRIAARSRRVREPLARVAATRVAGERRPRDERTMPEEVPVALIYDGTTHAVMMASPADIEDFAVGFSLTEGKISAPAEIAELEIVAHAGGHRGADVAGSGRRAADGRTGGGRCSGRPAAGSAASTASRRRCRAVRVVEGGPTLRRPRSRRRWRRCGRRSG